MKRTLPILLCVSLLLATGCFSKTNIYSKPGNARVVLNHKKSLGRTPVELKEQVWLWTRHSITVAKAGYESQTIQISSDGVNFAYIAVCVCTLGILLPIAFASSYPKQYIVELEPATPEADDAPVEETASVSFRE